ncbi:hypothetical protein K2P97_02835 [bacterium]|nr:hypothetical protein [bacterium]
MNCRSVTLQILAVFVILSIGIAANSQTKKTSFSQLVSGRLLISGDFEGHYSFNGPLGVLIKGSPYEGAPPCEVSTLFRAVKYREKKSLEAWLTLECTFQGQKSTYKTHRIFIPIDKTDTKIQLPMLAKNLKNVHLQFQELSLKLGK